MIFLGLLALLVVGVNFMLTGVAGLARGRRSAPPGGSPSGSGISAARELSTGTAAVAVLIAAHDREDRVIATLNSVARIVPLNNIHLVSDDSTDHTAELARAYGVRVIETFGRQGPAAAIESGIHAFRLLEDFAFVLPLEIDTRLDPHHLELVLPLFDDPSVAAVDVRVDPDRRTGRLLTAYRARAYALTQWPRGPGIPPTVARALPSVARTYRARALAGLEINPPGLAIPDFDHTLRLYRTGLGRVEFCPDVGAVPAQPTRLADYRRQTDQWFTGFWQAVRVGPAGLVVAAIELVLTGVLLLAAPVAIVAGAVLAARSGPVWPLSAGLAVLAGDYLLTLIVAVAQGQPRYLLAGLAFPFLRMVDAVDALRTLPRAWRHRPTADWLTFADRPPEPTPRPARPRPKHPLAIPLAVLGWLLVIASATATVLRVARTTATLPPSPVEPALIDSAYGVHIGHLEPAVDAGLTLASLQLRLYTTMTSAFDRGGGVLPAARELSVITTATMMLGLILVLAILRVHPLVTTVLLAALAICGPVSTLLTPVGPGGIAAAWLTAAAVAAVAAMGWRNFRWVTAGGIGLLVALATATVLIIPIGAGVAAGFAFARVRGSVRVLGTLGSLAVTGGGGYALWRGGLLLVEPAGPRVLGGDARTVVLGVVAAAAAGGLCTGWLRPVAVGLGAGAGFAWAEGAAADALLPALLLAAVVLVAVMIEEAAGQPESGPVLVRRVAAGLAAAVAITGSIAGVTLEPTSWTAPDHAGLATWVADNVDSGVKLVAPQGVWPDLERDLTRAGLPDGTVRRATAAAPVKPGELVVTLGSTRRSGIELVRFDTGPQSMSVFTPDPDVPNLLSGGQARAGAQLAENPRLHTTGEVAAALRAGRVDLRAMALLAELCHQHDITVAATSNPAHESVSPMPHRTIILSEVDGQSVTDQSGAATLLEWLRVQQPPYAPADTRVTPGGVTLRWRLPARLDQSPS